MAGGDAGVCRCLRRRHRRGRFCSAESRLRGKLKTAAHGAPSTARPFPAVPPNEARLSAGISAASVFFQSAERVRGQFAPHPTLPHEFRETPGDSSRGDEGAAGTRFQKFMQAENDWFTKVAASFRKTVERGQPDFSRGARWIGFECVPR